MKSNTAFILVGEQAIKYFENQEWEALEDSILNQYNGDIVGWNKETDLVSTLLDMLQGWSSFIELSKADLDNIEKNTKIEINYEQ